MARGDPVREHYAAIGVVAAEWSELEWLIDEYCFEIAGINPEIGSCFSAQISGSARKLDAYLALVQQRGAINRLAELHSYAKDTTSLAERQNRIVHDPWTTHGDGAGGIRPQRLEVTARRKLRRIFVEVSTKDVFKLAEDIRNHRFRLEALHERICFEIASSDTLP
jgi:hypothetical protein